MKKRTTGKVGGGRRMITGIWKRGLGFLLAACFSAFSTWTMFYRFSEGTPAFLPYAASGWSVGLAFLLCLGVFVFWQVAVDFCSAGSEFAGKNQPAPIRVSRGRHISGDLLRAQRFFQRFNPLSGASDDA